MKIIFFLQTVYVVLYFSRKDINFIFLTLVADYFLDVTTL